MATMVSSALLSSRKSDAELTAHPASSSIFLFSGFIGGVVVLLESCPARIDYVHGRGLRLFRKYLTDNHRVGVQALDNPPGRGFVVDAEFVASGSN